MGHEMDGVECLQGPGYLGWWTGRTTDHYRRCFFVSAVLDQSSEYEKTAPLWKVHTRYRDKVADETGGMGRRAWTEENLGSLERHSKRFKRKLVDMFSEHCDYGLYTLK